MEWKSWLSGVRFTLLFVGIVAVVVTVTSVLAERGFIKPSDWEVSASQWWGIVTAHFVNINIDFFLVNIVGLLVFAGWFSFSNWNMRPPVDTLKRFDSRFPWLVLGVAFGFSLLIWGLGRNGMGTSIIISAAFGAETGVYLAITLSIDRPFKDGSQARVGVAKWRKSALFFAASNVLFYVAVYRETVLLVPHWAPFILASLFGLLVGRASPTN